MPWLKSERKVHSEEGIYGVVLIDDDLQVKGLIDHDAERFRTLKDFFNHFNVDYRENEEKLLRDAISQNREAVLEVSSRKETMNLILLPLKLGEEKKWLLILKRRDITLDELAEIKDNILANVSHELLSPVTIAKASLEIAASESGWDEVLVSAVNAIERLENLLKDLVKLEELKQRSLERSQALKIEDIIAEAVRIIGKIAEERDISITTSIEDDLPEVVGDRDALVHLLLLLLNNAVKFSKDGSEVQVIARWVPEERSLDRGKVEVRVKDTGIGIPPEEQEKIFDLFYQVERGPSRRYSGMGVGLFLAKSIVEAHGGSIWVESEPGRGSTFYFTLPTSSGIEKRRL